MSAAARHTLRITPMVLAALALTVTAVPAQEMIIADRVTCARCSIELNLRLTLNTTGTGGTTGVPLQVVPLSDGRRVVRLAGQLPTVLSSNGRDLREIGRRGAGPGEFQEVADVARLPGDSLLLLDSDLSRASVLGPDGMFVRSVTLPFYTSGVAVLDWPRNVVVNGMSHTPDAVGWPLHLMDFSTSPARLRSSFGDNQAELRAGQDFTLIRRFFAVSGTSFWTHQITSYQLSRYSADGRIQGTIRRQPEWFARESPWTVGGPTMAPPPFLQAAAVRNDTLWVAAAIPRPDWQRVWHSDRIAGKRELTRAERPDLVELYKTRLEVIELRRGALVAQRDVDGLVVTIDNRLGATLYTLNRELEPKVQVFDLQLKR